MNRRGRPRGKATARRVFDVYWDLARATYHRTGFWVIGGGAGTCNPWGRKLDTKEFLDYKRAMGWN